MDEPAWYVMVVAGLMLLVIITVVCVLGGLFAHSAWALILFGWGLIG